ncbi:(E)-beta-farnesene synthase [Striga asiatica]|uniref:(E)-beta-farnesene synthase n=1 Tax=Striga asiatica TaxID=4170 RepID=A0A5A7Q1R7_STRAF|nr:(E)-beta-farnesene synthase [Striga asiatica]
MIPRKTPIRLRRLRSIFLAPFPFEGGAYAFLCDNQFLSYDKKSSSVAHPSSRSVGKCYSLRSGQGMGIGFILRATEDARSTVEAPSSKFNGLGPKMAKESFLPVWPVLSLGNYPVLVNKPATAKKEQAGTSPRKGFRSGILNRNMRELGLGKEVPVRRADKPGKRKRARGLDRGENWMKPDSSRSGYLALCNSPRPKDISQR